MVTFTYHSFVVQGFELRALFLLGKYFTTLVIALSPYNNKITERDNRLVTARS
jgi:N-acetylmuramic acid 6-phosphate (MurNAc-6-P) etherase